jgi:hypothetical protein
LIWQTSFFWFDPITDYVSQYIDVGSHRYSGGKEDARDAKRRPPVTLLSFTFLCNDEAAQVSFACGILAFLDFTLLRTLLVDGLDGYEQKRKRKSILP